MVFLFEGRLGRSRCGHGVSTVFRESVGSRWVDEMVVFLSPQQQRRWRGPDPRGYGGARNTEVIEDPFRDALICDEGDDAKLTLAVLADQNLDPVGARFILHLAPWICRSC